MRLLLVIPNIVSYRAFLAELCGSLAQDGVQVQVACSHESLWKGEALTGEEGVQMHTVNFARGMHPLRHLSAARALNRLVEKIHPDIVHAHFSAAIFTTALARTARWPVTWATFHGVAFLAMSGWKAKMLRLIETWAARRFDRVWALSDDDRDGLRATTRMGPAVQRLRSCGVGCNLEKFSPAPAVARHARRTESGFNTSDRVFAFVGRFVDFKGFALVVRAFLLVAGKNPTARLLLIGARDPLHLTGLSATEEDALKNSSRVVETGMCRDVAQYLAAADVLVFPSSREGMPVCVMEALAMGVPVITRDARGCRDVVCDGVNGLVLQECGVKDLAAAMERLGSDDALRMRLSANAIKGRERFDRKHFIGEQTRLYTILSGAETAAAPMCV